MTTARNVLGKPLETCCTSPMTGFYRNGCCDTGSEDRGLHLVCAQVTAEFLAFSKSRGNDLSTPMPMFNFDGLKPGDKWCLCVARWHEALQAIFKSISLQPKYVLDADIAKCFERIDHDKLLTKLETYPQLNRQIKSWLKSGYMDSKQLFPTNEGTPQGGVISPLLVNIALHGMELELKKFASTWKGRKQANMNSLSIIRYADDFVILHKDIERIIQCREIIENWLKELGLELKPSKTRISHTLYEYEGSTGFDFLGFNIRQYEVGKTHTGLNSHR
jgi:uncharacterized protein (DUF2237 family)